MESKFTRRSFLQAGSTAALAISGIGRSEERESPQIGERYEVEAPDTLDLAERAAMAINALTRVAEPRFNYETPECVHLDHRPPYMSWRAGGPILQRPIDPLPKMRLMSGSTFNDDVDMKMVQALTCDIDAEGLWWLKLEGHPGRVGYLAEDQVWVCEEAEFMVALLGWYKYDHNPAWLKLVGRMADGLAKIALRNGDRAWYYTAYTRSGWREHADPHGPQRASKVVGEPATRRFFDIGRPLQALSRWYTVSEDKQALDLARRLANFLLKPSMWGTGEGPTMVVAGERGLWQGWFHATTMGILGLLDYALLTKDARLQEFVANTYVYGRNFGLARIGFFPYRLGPLKQIQKAAANSGSPGSKGVYSEGCAIADMTRLAIGLSEAGVGDYWDDADQYVRNHLVEYQFLRRDLMEEIVAAGPEHKTDPRMQTDDNVIERNIGSFTSASDPTMSYGWYTMCCVGNCSGALYEVWKSILRYSDGIAQVNLLLNRASPWLDVDSYLPYEGKVVLKNKAARKAYVRIPGWADKKRVRCHVDGKEIAASWLNNYLIVEGLAPKNVVTIEFPVVATVEKYTELAYEQEYTCHFKGNTLVDISPRAERPSWTQMMSDDGATFPVGKGYPLFQRDFYKRDKAPMKKVQRYVASTLI